MRQHTSHLTPEEFIDAADARREFSHLDWCEACRRQVLELRHTIAAAADVEAPEPSPLFWDHFSNRVREAAASEKIAPAPWWSFLPGRMAVAAAAFAIVLLAAAISLRSPGPPESRPDAGEAVASADADAALQLIVDLSSDLDWDAASEAGLIPQAGWVDTVLSELDEAERAALEQLLQDEISRSGA